MIKEKRGNAMKIRIDETFYNIVQKDPELRNILFEFGFKPMKHDLQFSTVGKVVTIRKGLKHLDKDVEALNKWLEEQGSVHRFIDETIAANDEHETESQTLGALIKRLHEGENPEHVKEDFQKHFGSVHASEIVAMEQELVKEGMPIGEIQRLCDIHADVFNGSIEAIHASMNDIDIPGHPVHVLKAENKAITDLLETLNQTLQAYVNGADDSIKFGILMQVNELFDIEKHYKRKEECFFPLLEKHGFTAPPQVMWGVDDEIRADLSGFHQSVSELPAIEVYEIFKALRKRIEDMIFKEEMILLPMIIDVVTEDDWLKVAHDSKEIGYCLVSPSQEWVPVRKSFYDRVKADLSTRDNSLHFKVGTLRFEELEAVLNLLPIDITFVDKNDTFKYFNQTKDRLFFRSQAQIGRQVQHCHPPKSLDIVEGILRDFKSGAKDEESFWIEIKGKLIYITYYAVRDQFGAYMGTLEVSQDIKPYQAISGQKRLRD